MLGARPARRLRLFTGSCLCGGVQFTIQGDLEPIQVCHCQQCRKAQGTPFATNIPAQASAFQITKGSELLSGFESSPGKKRMFCSRCGSPIFSRRDAAPEVVRIRAGTLNEDLSCRPVAHFYTASKCNWWPINDGLPQFSEAYVPHRRVLAPNNRFQETPREAGASLNLSVKGKERVAMIDKKFAEHFASDWIDSWNSHDLDRILSHYSDQFEMSSPVIIQVAGESSGTLRGKDAVGAYWAKALQLIPDLRFELLSTLIGINSITLYYKGVRGLTAEVFHFGPDKKVVRTCS